MSTATFTPAPTPSAGPGAPRGATASGAAPHRPHMIGNAVRAARVLAGAAFSVVVMGEFAEEAGVHRRSR
ncbi:hypothetical protein [Streptomyces sp. NBC_00083]|uniref:hypothetical protein n=1 Tax=Streptomyces sp. NBC_00083 TaxID=2975647 RepID=UPI0022526DDA|nr:hypothetical protein [Streptomyces sp. NBC_00083]MCX5387905.1 hypothetical protein [Streptomyces sp. NBC_00083]